MAGIDDWEKRLKTDPKFHRPAEVYNLRGNPSKAKRLLGWEPKTRFKELVRIMVETDMDRLSGAGAK